MNRKLILKSPSFVLFGANLTHFGPKSGHTASSHQFFVLNNKDAVDIINIVGISTLFVLLLLFVSIFLMTIL